MTIQYGTSGDDVLTGIDPGGVVTVSQTLGQPAYGYSIMPIWGGDSQHVLYVFEGGSDNYNSQLYQKDLTTGTVTLVTSDANGNPFSAYYFSVSADGTKVAFESREALVSGVTANEMHSYVKDLTTGKITLVETDAQGQPLSADGSSYPVISPDGTKVAFIGSPGSLAPGSSQGAVMIKDLTTGAVTIVSHAPDGSLASGSFYDPVFSADGSELGFTSNSGNLTANSNYLTQNVYAVNVKTGAVTLVSAGQASWDNASSISFSADGKKAVFVSSSSQLTANDTNHSTDVFVKDLTTGAITLVTTDSNGHALSQGGFIPSISPDGTKVVFHSYDTTLPGNASGQEGLFVKDLTTGAVTRVDATANGTPANGNFSNYENPPGGAFNHDGTAVLFTSSANNLGAPYSEPATVFIKDFVGNDTLYGGDGNDTLDGLGGADSMVGGKGDDVYHVDNSGDVVVEAANEGHDTVFSTISYTLPANVEDLTLQGTAANGTGNELDNLVQGNGLANSLSGMAGNDTLIGGAGADTLDGGAGTDTASYATAGTNITASLANPSVNTGDAAGDVYISIENLTGGAWNDSLTGDANANRLTGGDGNDTLMGGAGADTLDGGNGNDTASYASASHGLVASLANPSANTGDAAGDTYISIENLTGTAFDDSLTGDANANRLLGGDGNDTLKGGAGNDTLDGGSGTNVAVFDFASTTAALYAFQGTEWVYDTVGHDLDTLTNIQSLQFSDKTLAVASATATVFNPYEYLASNLDLLAAFAGDPSRGVQHYIQSGIAEHRATDTFNAMEYLASNPDLIQAFGANLIAAEQHYVAYGYNEGRATTAFDAWEYLASNQDLLRAFGANAAAAEQHYVVNGYNEHRATTTFDTWEYLASNPDLIQAFGTNTVAAEQHYVVNGYNEHRATNSFNVWEYMASNTGMIQVFGTNTAAAEQQYVTYGYNAHMATNSFNPWEYLASNTDLIHAFGTNINAAEQHYVAFGYNEGRATTSFDAWEYLASNTDLLQAFGTNTTAAEQHYVAYGYNEHRAINSFDALEYIASNPDLIQAFGSNTAAAEQHYVAYGFNEHRATHSFNAAQYLANYPDLQAQYGNNLQAAELDYILHGYAAHRTDQPPH